MLTFVNKYSQDIFSQNGENGIIDECIKRIGLLPGTAVEFGAPTREYCSNINHLTGWDLRFFDINPSDPYITAAEITPQNVNEIIPRCSILSIDIDGNDYNVWRAYIGSPDIVIIEINSSLYPLNNTPVSSLQFGTCYKPMVELGIEKGYFLLCHTGNLIFVLNKYRRLFHEITGNGIDNVKEYFNDKFLE
jgi:hypothetical protein